MTISSRSSAAVSGSLRRAAAAAASVPVLGLEQWLAAAPAGVDPTSAVDACSTLGILSMLLVRILIGLACLPWVTGVAGPRAATAVTSRMAATVAPIGAIIGEWVGASSGLGLVMMQANARLQTDFMFAALAVVVALAVVIRLAVDAATRHLVPWAPETAR